MNKQLLASLFGILACVTFGGAVIATVEPTTAFSRLAANGRSIVLNHDNAPSISGGSATRVDDKGITWEYSNVSSYNAGHVSLNNGGFFGVSSASQHGVTGIDELTANFSGDELWLLRSTDGNEWHEAGLLTSGTATDLGNHWRYLRFYHYGETALNINSISMSYSCSGTSDMEDVDSAKANNVIATSSNLSYESEYSELSPRSIGGEAVRFIKDGTGSTNLTIGFGQTYTVGAIQNAKVEFDMQTSNINYGKTIQLMYNATGVGSSVDSSKHSTYKYTNIQDDWYHIEVPITGFISTISGYDTKDLPAKNVETKEVNGIKINAGNCVIDNLKIGSSECDLGIFNNPTYKPAVNEYFWLKVSWVGKLYPEQCTITFDDDTLARSIPLDDPDLKNGSPFYIQLLGTGSVTATCRVVCGYNRRVQIIQHTITVK